MADEIVHQEGENTPAPQMTEVEQRASADGWVPEHEWTGDPAAWRPAKEFLDRGELFKKIDEQKRELKQLKSTMEEFGKHHAKVKELEFQRALNYLKAQKKEALETGDHDAVVEIDEQIADTKEKAKEATAEAARQPAPPQEPNQDFVRWQARNSWYGTDRAMKAVADEVARDLVSRGEQDPVKVLAEVDRQIRKEFPHKFENPNRSKAGAVEAGSRTGRSASKGDDVTMTDAEKSVMNRIVRTGVITKEEYLKEFKARQAG